MALRSCRREVHISVALLGAILVLGSLLRGSLASNARRRHLTQGSDGGGASGACPNVPGFNYTVGWGGDPDSTINNYSDSGLGGNATYMGLQCVADCNCTAFNLQGETKSNSTLTNQNVPPDACFYARQDPLLCAPPEVLYSQRVVITPASHNAMCNGWNATVTGGGSGVPPGSVAAGPCTYTHDQIFVVTPTDSGYVTFNDGAMNNTRCLEVANGSTTVGTRVQISAGACQNASYQQFRLWTRVAGGYLIISRHANGPLINAYPSSNLLIQSMFTLEVLAGQVKGTSFVFAINPVACAASYVRNVSDVADVGACPSNAVNGQVRLGHCYQACKPGYGLGTKGDNSSVCWENCDCGTEGLGAQCSNYSRGLPTMLRVCNASTTHARKAYDRTLNLVCPSNSRKVGLATCQYNCAAGYQPGNGSRNRLDSNQCYLAPTPSRPNGCPSSQPVLCSGGNVCSTSNASCTGGIAQTLTGQLPRCLT